MGQWELATLPKHYLVSTHGYVQGLELGADFGLVQLRKREGKK